MPIYEYKCLDCGKVSEYFVRSNSKEEIVCKYCGSKNLKKLFSSVTVLNSEFSNNRIRERTCCGREERCSSPPCAESGVCSKR